MCLGSIPNDVVQSLTLQKYGIAFKAIVRMAVAFVAMSTAMAYAVGIQKLIYSAATCYDTPLTCPASAGGSVTNNISVGVQVPAYFLLAFAEISGFVILSGYSYAEAPKDMLSLTQAFRQVTAGLGSALGMVLAPGATDHKILYLHTGLATTMIISAPFF